MPRSNPILISSPSRSIDRTPDMVFKAMFGGYKQVDTEIYIDDRHVEIPQAASVIVTKVPFFGRGVKAVPKAKLDDGLLHVFVSESPIPWIVFEILATFFKYEMKGYYATGEKVRIITAEDMPLQVDGNVERTGREFYVEVLPREVKLRY